MTRSTSRIWLIGMGVVWLFTVGLAVGRSRTDDRQETNKGGILDPAQNAVQKVKRGRSTFRFDTFGDEAFWGGTLKLHQAIEGARFGGGISTSADTRKSARSLWSIAIRKKQDVDGRAPGRLRPSSTGYARPASTGRRLLADRSVKGNGVSTVVPRFIGSAPSGRRPNRGPAHRQANRRRRPRRRAA